MNLSLRIDYPDLIRRVKTRKIGKTATTVRLDQQKLCPNHANRLIKSEKLKIELHKSRIKRVSDQIRLKSKFCSFDGK